MYFLRDSFFCLQSQQQRNILDIFAYCLGSHVLHVTVANLQIFGFEFHLRSLPCAFSRQLAGQLTGCFTFFYLTVLMSKPGQNSCPWLFFFFTFSLHSFLSLSQFRAFLVCNNQPTPLYSTLLHSSPQEGGYTQKK